MVRRLALGYSDKEIAAKLKVSVKTVETCKARAVEKFRMGCRVDIVRFAARSGWLEDVDQPMAVSDGCSSDRVSGREGPSAGPSA